MKGGANYHASACGRLVGLVLVRVWLDQAKEQGLLGRFFTIADGERLVDAHGLVADRGDGKAHLGGELVVGLALDHSAQDLDLARS